MDQRDAENGGPNAEKTFKMAQETKMGFALPNAIGDRLKAYYDDVASEPVPDRFLSLLEELDHAEGRKKRKSDNEDVDG